MLRKYLQVAIVFLALSTVLIVPETSFAIGGPPPVVGILSIEPNSQTVQSGGSAKFNLTVFMNYPWLVGNVSFNLVNPPEGVTATFIPNVLTNFTREQYEYSLSMMVNVAEDAPQGNMTLTVQSIATMYPSGNRSPELHEGLGPATLYITAPAARTMTTTTTTTTITSTLTSEVTRTQIVTSTSAVTQTSTSTTTTLTRVTTATSTEQVADSSTYAWAVSATVAAAVLAVLLLLQRRPSPSKPR